jgi:hypothetical protein
VRAKAAIDFLGTPQKKRGGGEKNPSTLDQGPVGVWLPLALLLMALALMMAMVIGDGIGLTMAVMAAGEEGVCE